jgi:DNA sulfur modification protein DndD
MSIRSELERIVAAVKTYPSGREAIVNNKRELDGQLQIVNNKLQEIDNRIDRFSDKNKDEIKHKYQERAEHEERIKANDYKLRLKQDQLKNEKINLAQLESDFKKAATKNAECIRIQQLIEYAESGRDVIRSIEEEMIREVRVKMQERTTDYFTRLMWKKNTYSHIVLNEEYQLDLFHKDGYSCVGTCSAAERCLLALSFTLALHEVSGFNSLLVIDTPVARVSDENRKNFAKVLCDVSLNKQIIMTFTPDEYSTEIRNVFDPIASTRAVLSMIKEKVTTVEK